MVARLVIALIIAAMALAKPIAAADAFGLWTTSDADAHIKVAQCGDELCAQIVWLKEPNDEDTGKPTLDKNNPEPDKRGKPIIGLQIFHGMKPSSAHAWKGRIYNPDDGKSYEARP